MGGQVVVDFPRRLRLYLESLKIIYTSRSGIMSRCSESLKTCIHSKVDPSYAAASAKVGISYITIHHHPPAPRNAIRREIARIAACWPIRLSAARFRTHGEPNYPCSHSRCFSIWAHNAGPYCMRLAPKCCSLRCCCPHKLIIAPL